MSDSPTPDRQPFATPDPQPLANSGRPYAEFCKTLTPCPSPKKGEGRQMPGPLLPSGAKGLGCEGN